MKSFKDFQAHTTIPANGLGAIFWCNKRQRHRKHQWRQLNSTISPVVLDLNLVMSAPNRWSGVDLIICDLKPIIVRINCSNPFNHFNLNLSSIWELVICCKQVAISSLFSLSEVKGRVIENRAHTWCSANPQKFCSSGQPKLIARKQSIRPPSVKSLIV